MFITTSTGCKCIGAGALSFYFMIEVFMIPAFFNKSLFLQGRFDVFFLSICTVRLVQ